MHYIENDWFTSNWLWVLLFFIGSIVLISYINNSTSLLKKAMVSFVAILIITLVTSFYSPNFISINANKITFSEVGTENTDAQSPALFSNFINVLWNVLSSKINK
jgi:hypothetical protein